MEMSDFSWQYQKYARPEIYVATYVYASSLFKLKPFEILMNTFESYYCVSFYWQSKMQSPHFKALPYSFSH